MFDKYPYTDFHEMNLDWIIAEMKQLIDDWEKFSGRVSASAHVASVPEVTVSGDLKEGLDFDFGLVQGPRGQTGARGETGPQGPAGEGLQILDTYPTLAALQSAHPTGSAGDAYLVGSGGVFTLYIWSTSSEAWANAGSLTSPSPSSDVPLMDGVAAAGSSSLYARGDHVHPADTGKLDKSSSDGVYAVQSGSQVMLDVSDSAAADSIAMYDSVGDLNANNVNASGTISADEINITNNTILNSTKLEGVGGSVNAYQILTSLGTDFDVLSMGYDTANNTPTVQFNGGKWDNTGTMNSATASAKFTDSFVADYTSYPDGGRIGLAPATASRLGGVKPGEGVGIDSNGVLYNANMYRVGDTMTTSGVHCVGVLTGSRNLIRFFLPLSKPVANNTRAQVSLMTISPRGVSGSLFEGIDVASTSGYTISNSAIKENGIYFQITLDTAIASTTNNTPLDVQIDNLTINFIAL